MQQEIVELDVKDVIVKHRARKDDGDLSALEESIRRLGLIAPIVVDPNNVLVAGGRRIEACRRIGLTTILARRLSVPACSMRALSIQTDENLCRKALTHDELYAQIKTKKGAMTVKQPSLVKRLFR